MRRFAIHGLTILLASTVALSCGGGGDAPSVTTSSSFIASFTADNPAPGNNAVTLAQAAGGGGNQVTVDVGITGVNNLFGASFRIAYDPALVDFDNWSSGSLFEGSGETGLYQVALVSPGVVEVGVSCAGCSTGIDVTSTATLVKMIFSAAVEGNSGLTFVAADLLDAQAPPGPIPGLTWDGGTLTAQ